MTTDTEGAKAIERNSIRVFRETPLGFEYPPATDEQLATVGYAPLSRALAAEAEVGRLTNERAAVEARCKRQSANMAEAAGSFAAAQDYAQAALFQARSEVWATLAVSLAARKINPIDPAHFDAAVEAERTRKVGPAEPIQGRDEPEAQYQIRLTDKVFGKLQDICVDSCLDRDSIVSSLIEQAHAAPKTVAVEPRVADTCPHCEKEPLHFGPCEGAVAVEPSWGHPVNPPSAYPRPMRAGEIVCLELTQPPVEQHPGLEQMRGDVDPVCDPVAPEPAQENQDVLPEPQRCDRCNHTRFKHSLVYPFVCQEPRCPCSKWNHTPSSPSSNNVSSEPGETSGSASPGSTSFASESAATQTAPGSKASSGEAAGDGVTHQQARGWVHAVTQALPSWRRDIQRYIDQQEQAEREAVDLRETLTRVAKSRDEAEEGYDAERTQKEDLSVRLAEAKALEENLLINIDRKDAEIEALRMELEGYRNRGRHAVAIEGVIRALRALGKADQVSKILSELESKAKAAVPSTDCGKHARGWPNLSESGDYGTIDPCQANFEFIAAANPQTVLALVEVVRAARRLREGLAVHGLMLAAVPDFDAALAKLEGLVKP